MAFLFPFAHLLRRRRGLHRSIRSLVTLVVASGAFAAAPENPPPWHAAPPPEYVVRRVKAPLPPPSSLETAWQSAEWAQAPTLDVDRFHAKPDPLHPKTQARLLYDDTGIHVFFRVEDRYVRSVITAYQGPVSRDACVEFFMEPNGQRGYLNIEVNAGGTLLMKYHDPRLRPGADESPPGYRLVLVPWEQAQRVRIHHSLPKVVDPEITTPVVWHVQYFVPFEILEAHFGPLRPLAGRQWRANFYKISAATSHPHRATWAPIPLEARAAGFHQPRFFAPIRFE